MAEWIPFPLSGTGERPGVITMTIDMAGTGDAFEQLTVVFNATPETVGQTTESLAETDAELHPVLTGSAEEAFADAAFDAAFDAAAFDDRTRTFTVPGRTVAVRAG